MKYLIVSDIHGNAQLFSDVLEQNSDIDGVFFLGDGMNDYRTIMSKYPTIHRHEVNGNCDFRKDTCAKITTVCNKNIFYVHGDMYFVKKGLTQLCKAALSRKCDIVLFGHTHQAFYETIDGLHVFNPGALGGGMCYYSYGIMEISENAEPCFRHMVIDY